VRVWWWRDGAAGSSWRPPREALAGEEEVAPFAAASASRPALPGGVANRTGTGGSTSGVRTTGVTVSATAGIGTPVASASADVFSSVFVVVGGDAEAEETESFGGGGSGRDWMFDWLQRWQTQSLDLSEKRDRVR